MSLIEEVKAKAKAKAEAKPAEEAAPVAPEVSPKDTAKAALADARESLKCAREALKAAQEAVLAAEQIEAEAIRAYDVLCPPLTAAERIKQVNARSQEQRRKRAAALRAVQGLSVKSKLDQVMARGTGYGNRRPQF